MNGSQARTMDRRSFLYGASIAGFGVLCQGRNGWAGGVGPNETIQVACIGVGGKGSSDTDHAGNHGRVVALCDVDSQRLDAKWAKFKDAKRFFDFRELFDEMGGTIDAVTVSTADHTHAPAAVTAMRLGKHVYCQKPLTHSVWEARLMRETARKHGVCTQMGNQGTAHPGLRRGVEVVQAGAIGEVRDVHAWTNRPFKYWKQAPDIVARPSEAMPVPAHLHWQLSSAPRPLVLTIGSTTRTTGGDGGISERDRWETWPATPRTSSSNRSSSAFPRASRRKAGRSIPRPIRRGRPSPMSSRPATASLR